MKPDVITLNETHYTNRKKVNIKGYRTYDRNRVSTGGGIATLVDKKYENDTFLVSKGKDTEFVVTKHTQFAVPVNVINVYGESECRTKNSDVEDKWFEIVTEINKIENKGELLVLAGDLNKHVGKVINGNHKRTSFGGKLILDLLETQNYVLLNASNKVQGGPFTRFDPSDPEDDSGKSALDLIIVSKELVKHLDTFIIDKEQSFTPFRASKGRQVYPDHYAVQVVFKDIPTVRKEQRNNDKVTQWNLNKEGGWKQYYELTECNKKLRDITNDNAITATRAMSVLESEMTKIKFRSFGKVSYSRRETRISNKEVDRLQREKMLLKADKKESHIKEVNDRLTAEIIKQQRINLEKEIGELRKMHSRKGKSAALFSLKEKVTGGRKMMQEVTAVIDPETNTEITNAEKIKEISLKYCTDLLSNRSPHPG